MEKKETSEGERKFPVTNIPALTPDGKRVFAEGVIVDGANGRSTVAAAALADPRVGLDEHGRFSTYATLKSPFGKGEIVRLTGSRTADPERAKHLATLASRNLAGAAGRMRSAKRARRHAGWTLGAKITGTLVKSGAGVAALLLGGTGVIAIVAVGVIAWQAFRAARAIRAHRSALAHNRSVYGEPVRTIANQTATRPAHEPQTERTRTAENAQATTNTAHNPAILWEPPATLAPASGPRTRSAGAER